MKEDAASRRGAVCCLSRGIVLKKGCILKKRFCLEFVDNALGDINVNGTRFVQKILESCTSNKSAPLRAALQLRHFEMHLPLAELIYIEDSFGKI